MWVLVCIYSFKIRVSACSCECGCCVGVSCSMCICVLRWSSMRGGVVVGAQGDGGWWLGEEYF